VPAARHDLARDLGERILPARCRRIVKRAMLGAVIIGEAALSWRLPDRGARQASAARGVVESE
jgi:hypothetical protein